MRLLPYLTAVILLLCFGLFSCEKDYEELTILPDETDVVVVDVDNPVIDSTNVWDGTPGIFKATPSKGTLNEYDGYANIRWNSTPEEVLASGQYMARNLIESRLDGREFRAYGVQIGVVRALR